MTTPKRAPKGSIATALLLRLPEDLAAEVEAEAEREGISKAEWIRQAIVAALPMKERRQP